MTATRKFIGVLALTNFILYFGTMYYSYYYFIQGTFQLPVVHPLKLVCSVLILSLLVSNKSQTSNDSNDSVIISGLLSKMIAFLVVIAMVFIINIIK